MSHLRLRSLPGLVALVATLAQLVVAHELVFAGTLPLISLSHSHPVTLLAHEGHVDVVLHHESESPAAAATLEAERVHGGDHVLHVARAELSAKRWQERPPAAAELALGHSVVAVPAAVACAPRAPGLGVRSLPDGLRSTVLRI